MIRGAVILAAVAALLVGAPAANASYDINLLVANQTVISGVDNTLWTNTPLIQSSGTGVFDPFLRVQANGTETGMNTDGNPPLDTKAGIWTHSIQFSELAVLNVNGTDYYIFSVDINEPNQEQALLTMNELRIYNVAGNGALESEAAVAGAGTLKYNLDAIQDQQILMDYRVSNTGSGEHDMDFGIPVSFFAGVSGSDYLYMVVNFGLAGSTTGFDSADGFEEIHALTGGSTSTTTTTTEGPEPGTIALFGMGLIGLAAARRKS